MGPAMAVVMQDTEAVPERAGGPVDRRPVRPAMSRCGQLGWRAALIMTPGSRRLRTTAHYTTETRCMWLPVAVDAHCLIAELGGHQRSRTAGCLLRYTALRRFSKR